MSSLVIDIYIISLGNKISHFLKKKKLDENQNHNIPNKNNQNLLGALISTEAETCHNCVYLLNTTIYILFDFSAYECMCLLTLII